MGPGGVSQLSNIIGQDTGNEPRGGIGQKTHGIADPVVSHGCPGGFPVLVGNNGNGVFVIELNGFARGHAVTVDGVWGEFADPHLIRPQK